MCVFRQKTGEDVCFQKTRSDKKYAGDHLKTAEAFMCTAGVWRQFQSRDNSSIRQQHF